MSIRKHYNIKAYKFLLLIPACLVLFGCNKRQEDPKKTDSLPSITSQITNTPKATESLITEEATQVPDVVMYEKTIDSINVTIKKEDEKNKVILKNEKNTAEYDWPCDLTFGTPIIEIDKDTLYIILPEKEGEALLNVESICGSVHKINIDTFQEIPYTDEVLALKQQNEIALINFDDYEDNDNPQNGNLEVRYCGFYYFMKGFKYPVTDQYEVVLDDVIYYTDTLNEYRQLGIKQDNDMIWLGKMCYDLTDESSENIVFIPYQNLNYSKEQGVSYKTTVDAEQRILSGEKIILNPDDSLDLDLDGKKETISYERKEGGAYAQLYVLTVSDASIELEGYLADATATAVSLDGKSIQIMISTTGPSGADPVQVFYRYENSKIKECGCIESLDYHITDEGIEAYCITYHIQFYTIPFLFDYKDGNLIKKELDFYPQDTEVTALCDIPLYKEKNSTEIVFTLEKGTQAIIVGSDLKEWVYVKDINSGTGGWIRTKTGESDKNQCIMPDGTTLPSIDLFEGLDYYG